TQGIISEAKTNQKRTSRPINSNLEKAYPANEQANKVSKSPAVATMTLFIK
ncbi:unnamed protein product, partial [marine sediment metagenome]